MGTCYSNPEGGESHGITLCGSPKEQRTEMNRKKKGVAQDFSEYAGYHIDEDVLYASEVWEKLEEAIQLEVQASYPEYHNTWVEGQINERPHLDTLKVSLPHDIRLMKYKGLQVMPDETLYGGTWDTT